MMFLGDWLGRRALLTPDKVALLDAENGMAPITYRAWDEAAGRTANLLRGLGVQKGDRVAVLALNCVAYLDIWFACGKLGAIMQPLNYRLTPAELAALLDDATPCVLLYGAEYAEVVAQIAASPGSVRHWVPISRLISERDGLPAETEPIELDWHAPWVICYTGGTTGTPKGAVLTHGNIAANAVNTVAGWGLTPDDVAVLNAPMFHTGGMNVFTAPLVLIGGCSIVCKGVAVDQVFDLIERAGVTLYFSVPTVFIAMQQHPRWAGADFSRLKLVISGGAPCPRPVFDLFWERGIDFKTGYGLTEAGPNTFILPPADVRRKPGAVGYPLFFIDLKLVDDAGHALGPGQVGQLLIRGPHVCAGYWGRPQETARAIIDGWLHTGDLAVRDEEGYYTIVGRLKDVIISGGENIYPAEVESVLAGHPAVAEVALIAAPDPRWGEVGWAVAVPRPGQSLDPSDLLAFAGERLARYKLPKRVIVADTLPKTAAGKVDKQSLVRMYVTP
ncbi:long-chain fatty acid--CoA ligase [Chloroflexales bacterium ZM16-3]|nr:long-chain fatty acid--CoA ligase [Chloroflexales bacterium ZM16-3]